MRQKKGGTGTLHPKAPKAPKIAAFKVNKDTIRPILQIGGTVYYLEPVKEKDISEVIKKELEIQVKEQIKVARQLVSQYQEDCNKKVKSLQKVGLNRIIPPQEKFSLKYQVMVCSSSRGVHYILPFKYAPKSLGTGVSGRKLLHPEKLERDILIRFHFTDDGYGKLKFDRHPCLINYEGGLFPHYHKGCWGDFHMPSNPTVEDLPYLRDQLEITLHHITENDVAFEHPSGLPDIDNLKVGGENVTFDMDTEVKQKRRSTPAIFNST